MAKYEKQLHTALHVQIAMASTAKPPDPMPCALASILLPESRAHGCHMKKTLFPGTYYRVCSRAVPACGVRRCGVGARRESGQRHGCGEAVPDAAGGRCALVGSPLQRRGHLRAVCGRACGGTLRKGS
jgi:hypothetical protein